MHIDVISDTVCPWCYIGKRRLEQALALRPDRQVAVRWRAYQLDPSVPPEGVDRKAYIQAKFGDNPQRKQMAEALAKYGADVGIPFAFDRIERTPNTFNSHRLIRWAASAGVQNEMVEVLFRRYFVDGEDLGRAETLLGATEEVGMDVNLVAELLGTDADMDLIAREIGLARQIGVEGVPAYVVDDTYLLIGAQDPEVLAHALDRAEARRTQMQTAAPEA